MILCREAIIEAYEKGEIVIDPFDIRLVNPNSVDVRFGSHLFRMKSTYGIRDLYNPFPTNGFRSKLDLCHD